MVAWVLVLGGVAVVAYVLVGYPVVLRALAARRGRPPCALAPEPLPTVSVLISMYNEERTLARKIASLWALDYPPERLAVLVADDGSRDGTRALLERLAAEPEAGGRLRVLPDVGNLGKPAQLNRLAAEATGDVLVLTDGRQPLAPRAVRALVAALAEPDVGGASGSVVYQTPEGQPVLIGVYWRYEEQLRAWEGLLDSVVGAAGPLNAVRRELFTPFPPNLVLDDVFTPLMVARAGRRFVFVPEAQAIETFAMVRRHEYDRRVRTQAGLYQLVRLAPWVLLPWRNRVWWQLLSHRLGRLLIPWCLLAVLVGSLLGAPRHDFFVAVVVLQILFYGYATLGWLGAGQAWAPPGSSLAYNLVLLAVTALAGLGRELRGRTTSRWAAAEQHRR